MQSAEYFVAKQAVDRAQQIVERLIESYASLEEISAAVEDLCESKQLLDDLASGASGEERETVSIELAFS